MSTVHLFPLSAIKLAPENARNACNGEIRSLATSIAAEGLIDPLHAYLEGEAAMVWDGGRRLRALQSLSKSRRLPRGLAIGVPVLISDREAARRRSMVTFVREDMHPAEAFRAYKALFDAGQDPNQIAASMGVDAKRVAQLLKLSNLAPEILDAFAAGDFGLDTAHAFTLADDHDKQREALAACGDWINAGRVRQLLKADMTSPRDRLARFVGREAYLEAGGGTLIDLFADQDGETWTDSGLVQRLANEKLDAVVAELRAEGWGWVTVVDPYDYSWGHGYRRLKGEMVELTAEEQAAYDEAAAILDQEDVDPESYDEAEAVIADLDVKMERDEIGLEQRATAGVFVQVDGGGLLTVRRGYVEDAAPKRVPAAKAAAADDPALYGWGHTGHWHMTHVATAAVRHALLKDPEAAYDVLVASLAWGIARNGATGAAATKLEPRGIAPASIPKEVVLGGETSWAERRQAWRDRLPAENFQSCFDYVLALGDDEKAQIVSLGVGLAIDAVETRFDQRRNEAWVQIAAFARRAGVLIADAWRPDESFLSKGSKAALLGALAETGGADAYAKAKKREMVGALTRRVGETDWTPKLLRDLGSTPSPESGRPAQHPEYDHPAGNA